MKGPGEEMNSFCLGERALEVLKMVMIFGQKSRDQLWVGWDTF